MLWMSQLWRCGQQSYAAALRAGGVSTCHCRNWVARKATQLGDGYHRQPVPAPEFYAERRQRPRVNSDTSDSEPVIDDADAFRTKCLAETKPAALFQNAPVKVGFRIGELIARLARDTFQPRLVVREL